MGVVARSDELERGRALVAGHDGLRGLVVEGEAGIGKTTVWQSLVEDAARGRLVLSCRAAAAEATYAFASLSDLLAPVVGGGFDSLPEPQRVALEVALLHALPPRTPLNPRAVGVAVQTLLARAAATGGGVVVAIDDLQWVDAASAAALAYALRRLAASRVTVVATLRTNLRDPVGLEAMLESRLEHLRLGPLTLSGLFHVVREGLGQELARPTLQRIADASSGNPLLAIELARALGELDAQPGPGDPLPVPASLEGLMADRVRRLPAAVREALLGAAVLSSPTVDLLRRAFGDRVVAALAHAERAEILILDEAGRVRFTHPLLAAAVHGGATRWETRRAHAALAAALGESEEHVRHLALAAEGPDATVASALDVAAQKVDASGAPEAAAELAELALRLTANDAETARSLRGLALARYAFRAGDTGRALAIADRLHAELPAGSLRAAVCEFLVHVSWVARTGADAIRYAQQAIREAEDAAMIARLHVIHARVSDGDERRRSLATGLALLDAMDEPDLTALGHALTAKIGGEIWEVDELPGDLVERALELERIAPPSYVADRTSAALGDWLRIHGDFDGARHWLEITRRAAIDEGDESSVPYALAQLAQLELYAGRWDAAEQLARQHLAAAEEAAQTDQRRQALINLAMIHVHRGDVVAARAELRVLLAEAEQAADTWTATSAHATCGLLELSVGNALAALPHLQRQFDMFVEGGRRDPMRAHADYVEALVETGGVTRAAEVAAFLLELTAAPSPSPTRAVAHRAEALAAAARGDLDQADRAIATALELHHRAIVPFDLARTLYVVGQLQRRRGERRAARDAFSRALTVLGDLGAPLWTAKVEAEANRLPIKRAAGKELTPTELRVAQLIAAGKTTRGAAAELFISPKTVEANLARIYRKLGVRSRAELGAEMMTRTKM